MPVRKSVPVAKKNASNAVHDKRTFKNGSEAYEQDLEADLKSVREQIRELRQLDEKKNQLFEALTEKTLDALSTPFQPVEVQFSTNKMAVANASFPLSNFILVVLSSAQLV